MQDHVIGIITLRPICNAQGAYYVMILTTIQRLNNQHFAPFLSHIKSSPG